MCIRDRLGVPEGFLLAGFVGPFFPLFICRVSRAYPQKWKSINVWISISIQFTLVVLHLNIGILAAQIGIYRSFYFCLATIALVFGLLILYLVLENKKLQQLNAQPNGA